MMIVSWKTENNARPIGESGAFSDNFLNFNFDKDFFL